MALPTIPILYESLNYYINYTLGEDIYMMSTITPTQVYKHISPIVRKNMAHLFIHRLRNHGDSESVVEELSAIYDKTTLLQIYHEAVSEDHSSLCVNLVSKDTRKMLPQRFDIYLVPS